MVQCVDICIFRISDTQCGNMIIFQPTQILREINLLIYEL